MNFFKKISFVFMLVITLTVVGCSSKDKDDNKSEMHTIIDIKGNEVQVKKDVKGVAITPLPWTAVVYAIDGTPERIAGARKSTQAALDISILPKIDSRINDINMSYIDKEGSINMEEIARIKPEAAIIWDTEVDSKEKLEKLGIAPIMINSDTTENLKKSFMMVGKLLNKEKRAQEICDSYDAADKYLANKQEQLKGKEKPKVLFLRAKDMQVQAFSRYINNEVIEKSGGINVGNDASKTANVEINMEQIYKWNPDVIFITNFDDVIPEDLYNNKEWTKINAVKNNKVYKTPKGIYRWDVAGVESELMAKFMASKINPEVFNDFDFSKELKEYYSDFFNYSLSEEDINFITNAIANKNSK